MNHQETYYWKITAWDNHGATTNGPQWSFTTGAGTNNPPIPPHTPFPSDGAVNVASAYISWNCSDPDGDDLVYDIYFEADDPTPDTQIADDIAETTYALAGLTPATTYYWQIIAKDTYGATTSGPIWSFTTKPGIPDLSADGTLSWSDIKPGATVTGSFTIQNIGEIHSLLDWTVESYPSWGSWTITPNQGFDLTPEDGILTVNVTVIAPEIMNKQFSGHIKIINLENPDDSDTIYVSLATPHTQQTILQIIINRLLERFPNAFPILRTLIQNTQ
jgi:hypothetical protein